MGLNVVILAAGKGKRMVSNKPKVMHQLGGKPLLEHVVTTAQSLNPDQIIVIYGNGGNEVCNALGYLPVTWVNQEEQLGTGHAVQQALPHCKPDDNILVLYGDVPLISNNTLQQLIHETPQSGLGLVVAELEDPSGFGRIIRNELGNIISIVEHKDATAAQLKIHEINTGILTTTVAHLQEWLPNLKNNNKQGEYYLTDVVSLAVDAGVNVGGVLAHRHQEISGVNDRWQLATLERYYQRTQAQQLAYSGVTIMDPNRVEIRGHAKIDVDVVLDVNVVMEGNIEIGRNSHIGSNVYLKDVVIGENVTVLPNSVIDGATINSGCSIGPFARIRPGTELKANAKVGNFVEMKKATLGEGSKANHLSYLGDATIGDGANVGAGVITCNYDGVNKHHTQIEDGAFIGSNCSLVAPITIGKDATIGAGSTITRDAPADQLTVGRNKQSTVSGWVNPRKKDNISQV